MFGLGREYEHRWPRMITLDCENCGDGAGTSAEDVEAFGVEGTGTLQVDIVSAPAATGVVALGVARERPPEVLDGDYAVLSIEPKTGYVLARCMP
jgi:hypothetical protein